MSSKLNEKIANNQINKKIINFTKERSFTYIALLITTFAVIMSVIELINPINHQIEAQQWGSLTSTILFVIIVSFLIYGSYIYLLTRLSFLRRQEQHTPASTTELNQFRKQYTPSLTVLVPSYKEDEEVVFQTLMSAVLQDYSKKRIVLLIDDPPRPTNFNDIQTLKKSQELPSRIDSLVSEPREIFSKGLSDYVARQAQVTQGNIKVEVEQLLHFYRKAIEWFEYQISHYPTLNHADKLFIDKIYRHHCDDLKQRVADFTQQLSSQNSHILDDIKTEYHRLVSLFTAEIVTFERKRYLNLSHEPNKAMNLNSYIGLVSGYYREVEKDGGWFLENAEPESSDFYIPDTDYFLTLDADSIVVPDYAIRLIHKLEHDEFSNVAVIQTPYSAVPDAPGTLERIAGATTDIQYNIHQGFTGFNATYWVGANALLRKIALQDIVVTDTERGFTIKRYIQDHTVIEDTESSIDLVANGWKLFNYPERMAYSATPCDFGSFIIQRRRWANGGLLILPKLIKHTFKNMFHGNKLIEFYFRLHYLISIAFVNFGLLLLLAIPFTEISSYWLPLTALPYFLCYMHDLSLIGYRRLDIFKVYALNLLLIPINIGGVLKSLQQAWTGEHIPFGRTPKVHDRTMAPPLYIIAVYLLILHWLIGCYADIQDGYWAHAAFTLINSAFLTYALIQFVGFKESLQDMFVNVDMSKVDRVTKVLKPKYWMHYFVKSPKY